MGEWISKENQGDDEEVIPKSGMKALKLEIGDLDWKDKVTVGMPRQIFATITQIIEAMGLGEFNEVSPGVYMLVSKPSGQLMELLKDMLGDEDEDGPESAS